MYGTMRSPSSGVPGIPKGTSGTGPTTKISSGNKLPGISSPATANPVATGGCACTTACTSGRWRRIRRCKSNSLVGLRVPRLRGFPARSTSTMSAGLSSDLMNPLGQREQAALHQLRMRHAERGFEAHDPERRIVEGGLFFVVRVGRVIGGDAVDHALLERAAEGGDVGGLAERRVHLGMRIVLLPPLNPGRPLIRGHFRPHPEAPPPRPPEHCHPSPARPIATRDLSPRLL